MADTPPIEKVIERAYFHVGNGGLTLSVVEERSPTDGMASYRFKHEMAVFGVKAESSFPLGSSDIVSWMNMALQRVSMKVAASFHDRSFQPFADPADVTHVNGQEVAKTASLLRIVARYQRQAFEFPSPEALRKYLHEHPQADKSKHTVEKHEKEEKKPEGDKKPEAKPDDKKPQAKKLSWKDLAKSLSDKATAFIKAAPEQIKKFVTDDDFRFETLMKAHKAIQDAPAKFVEAAYTQAKHEVAEFKEAGAGVSAWMQGKEMSKEQKHAFKKVATHVAVAVVAGALSAGLGAGAVALGKGVVGAFFSSTAKKIAVKAVTSRLEHLPTFEELGHITEHGTELLHHFTEHFAAEGKKPTPEEVMKMMIASAVSEELKDMDPDALKEAIEEAAAK